LSSSRVARLRALKRTAMNHVTFLAASGSTGALGSWDWLMIAAYFGILLGISWWGFGGDAIPILY
ncbi:MAG: hypothetical protein NTY65_08440, partial [Planctomycetota bacterium]|nr:hypothetical protein [Planctomycetota bacterium]